MPTQAQRRRDCHTIPIMVQKTALTEIQTDTPVGTQEEKKQKELDRKRAQKTRKAERELNPDMPPPEIPSVSLPPPPTSPPPPFHFAPDTAALTPARDGLAPPPSWVFERFAEAFTDRERDFAGANQAEGVLHELLADALRFGWESGLKKGRSGGKEGIERKTASAEALQPVAREFFSAGMQTDTAAVIIPRQESPPPLIVTPPPLIVTPPPLLVDDIGRSDTLPLRDLSTLRSDSSHPFGTLQRRLARSRRTRQKSTVPGASRVLPPIITRRHPHGISPGKPVTTAAIATTPNRHPAPTRRSLDWDRDPLLSDLARALGALGWTRRVS
ncbi:hypothetical protein C8J57DRAFT_1409520 [Mycena rebaudengoi]|nr:hypothetical protein C8J57DRAFT_1409520 [Mycena rebaudengoi]